MKDARITLYRLRNDQAFQRGLEAGGELLVQASSVLGRNGGTVSEITSAEDDVDFALFLEQKLEDWAVDSKVWFPQPEVYYREAGYQFYGYGGEAQIFAESDRYVHKICRVGQYDNLQLFFDRLAIHNAICPEACLLVEGFGRDSLCNFVVLLKQVFSC